jgi:tetratricopeptide (TPR) repeat protein
MRVLASGSYNVAWFKLADFISRGEKERALSIHRLLMHSVQDVAIAYQLEGDILLAFDDNTALDRYHVAANLYKKAGKIKQAISVYEHVSLFKEDENVYEALLDIYIFMQNTSGTLETFSRLAKVCLTKDNLLHLDNLFQRYILESSKIMQARLSARFVRAILLYDEQNIDISIYTYQTLDLFKESLDLAVKDISQPSLVVPGGQTMMRCTGALEVECMDLQRFLSDLKALDTQEYLKAIAYLETNF